VPLNRPGTSLRRRLMKARRLIAPFVLLAIALACTDRSPTAVAPPPPPQADLIGSLLSATGLLKCSNLPYASSTQTIGVGGGVISAGPHTPVIPPGALLAPPAHTMSAPPRPGANPVER